VSAGDEWKDDPEPDMGGFLGSMFREPTAEEKAEWHRKFEAAKIVGEAAYLTLQRFGPSRLCVKCGHDKRRVRHLAAKESRTLEAVAATAHHEVIGSTCKRCNYTWYEKPMDADL
jgi:predicted nucleic-acid-binding Zn-ribbon protein